MSQLFHSSVNNITPWQATYQFPSQATKNEKTMVKLQAKTGGGAYTSGQVIRFEFPSDQYLNPLNTVFSMDLEIINPAYPQFVNVPITVASGVVTIGSGTPGYNVVNAFVGYSLIIESGANEGLELLIAAQANTGVVGFTSAFTLSDDTAIARLLNRTTLSRPGIHSVINRIKTSYGGMVLEDLQDYDVLAGRLLATGACGGFLNGAGSITDGTSGPYLDSRKSAVSSSNTLVSSSVCQMDNTSVSSQGVLGVKRYNFRPFIGLMNNKKLIPLKWMASSLMIEIWLNTPQRALFAPVYNTPTPPTFSITEPTINAELINFDSSYDTGFYMGMAEMGIPLKFSSWHHHVANLTGSRQTIQIHERARSIKFAWAVIRDATPQYSLDSSFGYHAAGTVYVPGNTYSGRVISARLDSNTTDTVAHRGKVSQYQFRIGGRYYPAQFVDCSKGGAEPFIEMLKTVDALNDYQYDSSISARDWSSDYDLEGGQDFMICAEFENADVNPDTVSGINGMEQSDLMLDVQFDGPPNGKIMDIFVCYDSLLIIRPENSVELII